MTYKDITPTFNAGDRKVVNFKDFLQHSDEEKEELKDIKKNFTKNAKEIGLQQHKYKFNKVTHKMDDVVEDEVDDRLEAFEENTKFDHLNNIPNINKLKSLVKEIWEDGFESGEASESASYQRDFEDFWGELGDKFIIKISDCYDK
jgi:predicted translin family RNA/ssDNA-binding protein